MFSSLKKWVKNDENTPAKQFPHGMQTMRSDLQKKFAKGVQYNMKIILRGDRNTGKTCLWHRLQGHKFIEGYVPTPEIQAASIHWNYKATEDIVKVDVWDVVDKGKPKQNANSLKMAHETNDNDPHMLDANFLDVYKGAHAVLLLFDITKKWTYQYVERELPKVPANIPVLILANFRDMGSHRVIPIEEIQVLADNVDRPPGSAGVFFIESSMKTNFGLKYIHKFFNLPFLILQRESLLKQLETNHLDVESCLEELQYEIKSDEQNYDTYLKIAQEKRVQEKAADKTAAVTSAKVNGEVEQAHVTRASKTTSKDTAQKESKRFNPPTALQVRPDHKEKPKAEVGLFSPSMMSDASSPTECNEKEPAKKGFMSRFFNRGSSTTTQESTPEVKKSVTPTISPAMEPVSSASKPVDIDQFVPDSGSADNFLDEIPDTSLTKGYKNDPEYSSSEDEGGNPMVAGFQEELDSDDQVPTGAHNVYSYADSDDDYVSTPKTNPTAERLSTRSHPVSRIEPTPKKEIVKRQLVVDSDSSPEIDYRIPANGNENNFDDTKLNDESLHEHEDKTTRTSILKEIKSQHDHGRQQKKSDKNSSQTKGVEESRRLPSEGLSSEEDTSNQMVSTVTEDVPSADDVDAGKIPFQKPQESDEAVDTRPSLQLQSSDFDFLEQIATSPVQEVGESHEKVSKTPAKSKHKSKSSRKKDADHGDETSKKHRHKKKKKTKAGGDADERKKNKKKVTKEEDDLEAFLEGD